MKTRLWAFLLCAAIATQSLAVCAWGAEASPTEPPAEVAELTPEPLPSELLELAPEEELVPIDPTETVETAPTASEAPAEVAEAGSPTPTPEAIFSNPSFEPIQIGAADPVNRTVSSPSKKTITYSDGTTATYDKSYKPLFVNGTLINCNVLTIEDRTLVPVRFLVEALGGQVGWNEALQEVTVVRGPDRLILTIGSPKVIVNGVETYTDVPPGIYGDYTYLPVRFVSESLGAKVSYNTGSIGSDGKFQDYAILQGAQGNVLVDQENSSWAAIPQQDAVSKMSYITYVMLQKFKALKYDSLVETYGKAYVANALALMDESVLKARVIGEASRYYVIESAGIFLFDKYSGAIYNAASDAKSTWVSRFDENNPESESIFLLGYFYA
ncbi:MAG: hypothetical protein LBT59_20300 [Clostridiales bacterium]|jgi:phage baseplate assembly protein gpV|nr:hypothetical protein [Clostridiales bacterium]